MSGDIHVFIHTIYDKELFANHLYPLDPQVMNCMIS